MLPRVRNTEITQQCATIPEWPSNIRAKSCQIRNAAPGPGEYQYIMYQSKLSDLEREEGAGTIFLLLWSLFYMQRGGSGYRSGFWKKPRIFIRIKPAHVVFWISGPGSCTQSQISIKRQFFSWSAGACWPDGDNWNRVRIVFTMTVIRTRIMYSKTGYPYCTIF